MSDSVSVEIQENQQQKGIQQGRDECCWGDILYSNSEINCGLFIWENNREKREETNLMWVRQLQSSDERCHRFIDVTFTDFFLHSDESSINQTLLYITCQTNQNAIQTDETENNNRLRDTNRTPPEIKWAFRMIKDEGFKTSSKNIEYYTSAL